MWLRALSLALALLASGCMVSEQLGEPPQELSFHFNTQFNRFIVYGRSAALLLLAWWVFAAERGASKKVASLAIGLPALAAAFWLVYRDYAPLRGYRIDVLPSGLYLDIPPEPKKEIPWQSIQLMSIKGIEYQRGTTKPNPFGSSSRDYFTDLPEWHTMELKLLNNETHLVNLERLSVEQRQTLWRAIARRANLFEQK